MMNQKLLACGAEDTDSAIVYVVCDCNVSMQPLKYFNSSPCLWDIKNNSKIAQKESGKLMEMSKFACL
jgi:hypothetical protein